MAEVSSPEKLGQVRRKLFKAAPKVVVAAGLSYLATHESELARGGFVIDGVKYFPLYEAHDVGPRRDIPSGTSAVFFELNVPVGQEHTGGIYDLPPAVVLSQNITGSRREALTRQMIKEDVVFAFGDVFTNQMDHEEFLRATNPGEKLKMGEGLLLMILGLLPEQRRLNFLKQKIFKTPNRRQFLKITSLGAVASGAWLAATSSGANKIFGATFAAVENLPSPTYAAFERVAVRAHGLISHFNPERAAVFFRNIIWANKTLLTGEHFKPPEPESLLPSVSFNVGMGHGGMEDFLYLPRPILREMILRFDRRILENTIKDFGIDNFCAVRLIKVDKDGAISDEKVIDQELKTRLAEMFPEKN